MSLKSKIHAGAIFGLRFIAPLIIFVITFAYGYWVSSGSIDLLVAVLTGLTAVEFIERYFAEIP